MKKTTILSLLMLLSPGISLAGDNEYKDLISKLPADTVSGYSGTLQDSTVYFHGIYSSQEEKEFLAKQTVLALSSAQEFKTEKTSTCYRNEYDLHIYYIPSSIINDRATMSFLSWHKWSNKSIYGAFDSTTSPEGTVTVFISSSHSKEDIRLTIYHEIYHYWQFKNCIELNEPDAYLFEKSHNH